MTALEQPPLDPRFRGISFRGAPSPRPQRTAGVDTGPIHHVSPIRVPTGEEMERHPMADVAFVRRMLRLAGIRAEGYRITPLIRRIPACLRALRVKDQEAADQVVAGDPQRLQIAVNALLIGTTSFFRDTSVFRELDESVIPALLTQRDEPRVWSAACSDGSELASVVMLFAKHGGLDRSRFLGTDCRPSALRQAAEGIYPPEARELFLPDLVGRFLRCDEKHCRLHPSIATAMEWKLADLLAQPEGSDWDLILCRNLAIYLHPHQAQQLWLQLETCLRPGGFLIVGKAEKPQVDGLQRVSPCVYRKDSPPVA